MDNTDASELEQQLMTIWADALKVPVARDGNLFELGGDSLVAAQLAGRIIEELPEARTLFFDELLRQVLEQATVAGLANWISQTTSAQPEDPDPESPATTAVSLLVPVRPQGTGVPQVFLADAASALAGVDSVVAELSPEAAAYGLSETALAELPQVEQVAAAYAQAIIDADLSQVQLHGQGVLALLAVEVARHLVERGVIVESVVLHNGYVPNPSATDEQVQAQYATWAGSLASPEGLHRYSHAYAAIAGHQPSIYAGDLTLVQPADAAGGVEFWEEICLGEITVVQREQSAAELRWSAYQATVAQ